jgi:hypothetical protein|mmetsp:Transcript_27621/g.44073  ORF Transcript_27621/g.44073 Transcript_27621/m.44073 type:complete len:89 (-) Transcript_27621:155-421(-)
MFTQTLKHEKPTQPTPCENNAKLQKFDGNNTHCWSDMGIVCAHVHVRRENKPCGAEWGNTIANEGQQVARQKSVSPEYHPQPQITEKN